MSETKSPSAHEMVRDLAVAMQEVVAGLSDRIKKLDTQVKNVGFRATSHANDIFESMEARMAELEERKSNAMIFQGQFDRARAYEGGDLVSLNDKLYVAAKAIEAGGHLREGVEGWVKVFSRTPNHE